MTDLLLLEQKIKQMRDNLNLYIRTVEELTEELEHYKKLGAQLDEALENQRLAAVVSILSRKNTVYDCRLVNGYISSYMSKIANYNRTVEEMTRDLDAVLYEYEIKSDESLNNVIYLEKVKNARK